MKKMTFNKERNGNWYVDLPSWTGDKADLQMVCGADTMLDYIAQGSNQVTLNVSEQNFENADNLKFKGLAHDIGSGAFYTMETYKGISIELEMWLCDVMLAVFNGFPKNIFISTID